MIAAPKHASITTLPEALLDSLRDCIGVIMNFSGLHLLIISFYLRPSEGLSTENRRRLGLLLALTKVVGLPWIAMGALTLPPATVRSWAD